MIEEILIAVVVTLGISVVRLNSRVKEMESFKRTTKTNLTLLCDRINEMKQEETKEGRYKPTGRYKDPLRLNDDGDGDDFYQERTDEVRN